MLIEISVRSHVILMKIRVALNSGLFIFLSYINCFSTENATDKKQRKKEVKIGQEALQKLIKAQSAPLNRGSPPCV